MNSRKVQASQGFAPAGYLYGSKTDDEIFTFMDNYIKATGDAMKVSGVINTGTTIVIFSRAERVDATTINFFGLDISGSLGTVTITKGSSAFSSISLAL